MLGSLIKALLGIHTEETRSERGMCTPMFITGHGSNLDAHQQTNGSGSYCTYTQWNYSAIKKNTFESVLMRWMKLEPIYRVK